MTKMTMSRAFGVYPIIAAACVILTPLMLSFAAANGAIDDILFYPGATPSDCNVISRKVLASAYVFYRFAAVPLLIVAFYTVYRSIKYSSGHEIFFIGLTAIAIGPFICIWVIENPFIPKTFLPAICSSGNWSPIIIFQFLLFGACTYFIVGAAVTSSKLR